MKQDFKTKYSKSRLPKSKQTLRKLYDSIGGDKLLSILPKELREDIEYSLHDYSYRLRGVRINTPEYDSYRKKVIVKMSYRYLNRK